MRRPQDPNDEKSPDDQQPPGGRAWQRVRDFERARGLPAESTPNGSEESRTDKDKDNDPPENKR